jgi:hypothetical protein
MIGATALHTRAKCDECARPATREGVGGIVLCDGCAIGLPRPANDDLIAAALNSLRICTRCQIRPAMLRVDETRALCSECWRQLDAKLSDFSNFSFAVATRGDKVTAAVKPAPGPSAAVTAFSKQPDLLALLFCAPLRRSSDITKGDRPCLTSSGAADTARKLIGPDLRTPTASARLLASPGSDGPNSKPKQLVSTPSAAQMPSSADCVCGGCRPAPLLQTLRESGVGPDAANPRQCHLQGVTGGESAAQISIPATALDMRGGRPLSAASLANVSSADVEVPLIHGPILEGRGPGEDWKAGSLAAGAVIYPARRGASHRASNSELDVRSVAATSLTDACSGSRSTPGEKDCAPFTLPQGGSPVTVGRLVPKSAVTPIPADADLYGLGPLQFGCPICARIDCDWTHGAHPKYAATSASFAASATASADNSKSEIRGA